MVCACLDSIMCQCSEKVDNIINIFLGNRKNVSPKLDKSKIRLVIFADSDHGRTPYFDSNAIRPMDEMDKNNIRTPPKTTRCKYTSFCQQKIQPGPHQKMGPKYHFHKLGSDVKVLEEMMFGNVAMSYKGSSVKVHVLRSPPQLMVTNVFIPEKPSRENIGETESGLSSLPGSSLDLSSGEFSLLMRKSKEKYERSIPMDVPSKDIISDYSTDEDSGLASFTSSGSLCSSFPSPSNNTSSYNSLHRRWMRAQTTTLDGHNKRHMHENILNTERTVTRTRKKMVAIGILFSPHDEKDEESIILFQSFFFSHFALIEGHVEKLRCVVEKAYFNSRTFLPATIEALETFRNSVYDLFMAPRLPEPVWLTMMSTTTYKTRLCDRFMQEFVSLVAKFDNKNCKFFVSTLLSAVLTHHLAWVATVTPAGGTPSKTYLDKHSAKWLDTLAKTHPYNPLWAQLGDLFGAIGEPLKISRTVIIGKKADIVKRFLYILSYFIRCSDIHENSDLDCLSSLLSQSSLELSCSPTPSEKTMVPTSPLDRSFSPTTSPPPPRILTSHTSIESGGSDSGFDAGSSCVESLKQFSNTSKTHNSVTVADACHCGYRSERTLVGKDLCEDIQSDRYPQAGALVVNGYGVPVIFDPGDSKHATQCKINSDISCGSKNFNIVCSKCGRTRLSYNKCSNSQHKSVQGGAFSQYDQNGLNLRVKETSGFSHNHLVNSTKLHEPDKTSDISPVIEPSSKELALSEIHIPSPNSIPLCSLITSKVVEVVKRENIAHVAKSSLSSSLFESDFSSLDSEPIVRSQSFSDGRIRSKLSQLLECEVEDSEVTKSKTVDVKKLCQSQSSNNMFDENFELNPDVKTLDQLSEKEKVFVSSNSSSSSKLSVEVKRETESKPALSRQNSHEVKSHLSRPANLGHRGRSITPTELNRRRHLSSTSSIDYETFDPVNHCMEIKMPEPICESSQWNIKAFDRNFGRSLLATHTDHYMSDFVLHGTSDNNFKSSLLNDLQMTVQHSILDEPIDEAVCVIADTDNWTVEVASSKVLSISPSGCTTWTSSQLVADLIESVVEIFKLKMSPEFCLMHVEDRLQEIYFKSLMLSEYLRGTTVYNQRDLTSMLGFEISDMPLLLAIAGTHTPSLALGAQ